MSASAATPDPQSIRALAELLVSVPSVSPDAVAESRCAETLAAHLPAETTHGVWSLADGRPVVWALLEGRSPRTVLMLGHYDTVSARGFAAPDVDGAALAFDPRRARARLLERRRRGERFDETLEEDLAREEREPGTWMFGRGALDMKAALAAGIAAMESLVRAPRDGHVLFVATPDEEHASAGMIAAVPEIVRMRDARELELLGAVNLDLVAQPGAYRGAAGKLALGMLVLGVPAHVGATGEGLDAAQLAAAIALHATTSTEWAGALELSPAIAPALLSLRDLREGYDVQTTSEAFVELNIVRGAAPLARVLQTMERVIRAAAADVAGRREHWGGATDAGVAPQRSSHARAWTERLVVRALAELPGAPEVQPALVPQGVFPLIELRRAALRAARERVARAGIAGPAVIPFLLPPYYPPLAPRDRAVSRAAGTVLAREGLPWLGRYPFISDACYGAWDGEPARDLAAHLPGIERLGLPETASARLDLDVVTLGPWGREPHGRFERVYAPYAFESLPRLLAAVVGGSLREGTNPEKDA